ncbi:MAG: putative sugar O-methyltransferase [Steroidobacteraceae bacterium]
MADETHGPIVRSRAVAARLAAFLRALQANPGIRNAARRRSLLLKGGFNRMRGAATGERDVQSYRAMQADNVASPPAYQAGEFWARLNRQHANAIWGGGLENLRNEYFNRTFSGPEPESRQVYRALLHLYYKHVRLLDIDGFLEREQDPVIGGTGDQEVIFGRALSLDFLQSVEEAYRIRNAWRASGRDGDPKVILELGAGYGRLAYVCRRMMPDVTYVILDLPEALVCAQSWLSRVLTDEVVPFDVSRSATDIGRDQLQPGSVYLFLPHKIEAIRADAVDVFVNIYSFAEMPVASISNYFSHLDRITSGIFYMKQRALEVNAFDGSRVGADTYPVPAHWRLLFRGDTTLYDGFFEAAYVTRGT